MPSAWTELTQSVSLAGRSLGETMREELGTRCDAEEYRTSINAALPAEMLTHVLTFCHPKKALLRICLVCKVWNDLARRAVNLAWNDNYAIRMSCFHGYEKSVDYILKNPRVDPTALANEALYLACMAPHKEVVKLLVLDGRANPSDRKDCAVICAARHGWTSLMEIILADSRADATGVSAALWWAVRSDCLKVVRLILKDSRANIAIDENRALAWVCKHGRTPMAALLLEHADVDPAAGQNRAICLASLHGHTAVVKLLLAHPRVDPADRNNGAMRSARIMKHTDVVVLLLGDERVHRQRARAYADAERIRRFLRDPPCANTVMLFNFAKWIMKAICFTLRACLFAFVCAVVVTKLLSPR